jgi:hypothetical protein
MPKVNTSISQLFVKLVVVDFAKWHGKRGDVVSTAYMVVLNPNSAATYNACSAHTIRARFHDSSPSEE